MGVPRAKKQKKQQPTQKQQAIMQEMQRAILYLYDADVKKQSQAEIIEKNLFYARTILALRKGTITPQTILDNLERHNVSMQEISDTTDKFVNDNWEVWG